MFIKTSHPPGDNSWCWALGVICPWCCWHWHRAPGHLTIVSRDAITGILFTSGGVNIETWEELSPTTSWQREIWLWRAKGFLPASSKDPFMRNHALWFLDQTLYGKGFVESPERKYLNEQQVSGWTVTKKTTWPVWNERYLLNEMRMFRIKPLLTFH